MKSLFLKQAIYLPIFYFGTVIFAGFFAIEYSHIGQQVSELALNKNSTTRAILSLGIFITGVSMILMCMGIVWRFRSQYLITSTLILVFGITFLFGAIFPIGSPWHSVYGLGFCVVLLPFAFLAESDTESVDRFTKTLSVFASVVLLIYFWSLLAELHPWDYRGLAQRVFGVAVFGFMSRVAYVLCYDNKT